MAWILIAVVVWNGVYDLLLTRGVKDYLLREALHQAGRGPDVRLSEELDIAVRYASWMATLWASLILLAGLWTLRAFENRDSSPGLKARDQRPATSDLD